MNLMSPTWKRGCRAHASRAFACLLTLCAAQAMATDSEERLADLSLEELLGMEITTLSRKTENLGDAPAAVFVISSADIRRSGAKTIPDLLRMVPGMQVAQIDGNKWAVTARGANGRFANKLLVLMDGRTLYNPLLSGVYWDIQDTDFDAIERIEVIRGPGATMWGANAVNGVVNIITRNAADTQGGSVNVLASAHDTVEGVVRYGATSGDVAYRVFAKFTDRDGNVGLDGTATNDDSNMARLGMRADRDTLDSDWSFSAEVYSGDSGETRINASTEPPYQTVGASEDDVRGAFALMSWATNLTGDSSLQVRGYVGLDERVSATLDEKRNTIDLDVQHQMTLGDSHQLMWGIGYRNSRDRTKGTFQISLSPAERSQRLLSAFVQDDIALFGDRARLIVGSKFEHGNFSPRDVEVEPSVRLSVSVGEFGTLWGSASRAVRLPSRGEQDGAVIGAVLPPGQPELPLPLPLVGVVQGNPDMRSEEVFAYELGYRLQRDDLLFDVALFYNDYDKLRSLTPTAPTCQPGGSVLALDPACVLDASYVLSASLLSNDIAADAQGVEMAVSKQLTDWWRLHGGYTYYEYDPDGIALNSNFTIAEDSPEHQFTLRSAMDLRGDMELDLWVRHVSELASQKIDDYTALDLRLTWSPSERLNIAAVGRNLLAGDHQEFMSELGDLIPVEIEPEGYVEVTWSF